MLAARAHVSPLGIAIDCGAFVSMFACVLACATAAARVLLRMAHDGLLPQALQRTSPSPRNAGSSRAAFDRAHVRRHHGHGAPWRCRDQRCMTCWGRFQSLAFSPRMHWSLLRFPSHAAPSGSILICSEPERCHRCRHPHDRDLRSSIRFRHCSRANTLPLSHLHRRWVRVVCTAAKKSPRLVMHCGKALPYPGFHTKIPYVNFMPQQLEHFS